MWAGFKRATTDCRKIGLSYLKNNLSIGVGVKHFTDYV